VALSEGVSVFKDEYRDFFELLRERELLRNHNKKFKEGDPQDGLLMLAEGAITLITLERFLRILPGVEAAERDTLPNLLERTTSAARNVLILDADNRAEAIKKIASVRNTILHGNFEQAAKEASVSGAKEYFKNQYIAEVEAIYKLPKFAD